MPPLNTRPSAHGDIMAVGMTMASRNRPYTAHGAMRVLTGTTDMSSDLMSKSDTNRMPPSRNSTSTMEKTSETMNSAELVAPNITYMNTYATVRMLHAPRNGTCPTDR